MVWGGCSTGKGLSACKLSCAARLLELMLTRGFIFIFSGFVTTLRPIYGCSSKIFEELSKGIFTIHLWRYASVSSRLEAGSTKKLDGFQTMYTMEHVSPCELFLF